MDDVKVACSGNGTPEQAEGGNGCSDENISDNHSSEHYTASSAKCQGSLDLLLKAGLRPEYIQELVGSGCSLDEIAGAVDSMLARGQRDELLKEQDDYFRLKGELTVAELDALPEPTEDGLLPPMARPAKSASAFGKSEVSFLWYPYLPIGDYSVMMAAGGTGKTICCCGIAAAVSTGRPLPGDRFRGEGSNVLYISAEDTGELLRQRLELSGADLNRVYILDCNDSIGLSFSDGYDEFEQTVRGCQPALVIIDPWHAFLGAGVDINRVNALRPVFQKLAHLAKVCDAAIILVSHVNKRAQGENANNAAIGSADFINASRSAFQVAFTGDDENRRVLVHTKANYAPAGKSVCYRIVDGGLQWDGFSPVTRQTLEEAGRRRTTPWEVIQAEAEKTARNDALVTALEKSANPYTMTRFTYEEFKARHGELIFGGSQPKRALDAVRDRLNEDGYYLRTGRQFKRNGVKANGFDIQKINAVVAEQTCL